MRAIGGIILAVSMAACGGQARPVELTDDEIDWCTRNVEPVIDAYNTSGAPTLEGNDSDVFFAIVTSLGEAEILLGASPSVTHEQRDAIREACRSAFEADSD